MPLAHEPPEGGEEFDVVVVGSRGEAHGHPGLHVACSAALPGPVGPNPSVTIAAWAERVAAGKVASRTSQGRLR